MTWIAFFQMKNTHITRYTKWIDIHWFVSVFQFLNQLIKRRKKGNTYCIRFINHANTLMKYTYSSLFHICNSWKKKMKSTKMREENHTQMRKWWSDEKERKSLLYELVRVSADIIIINNDDEMMIIILIAHRLIY